MSGREQQEGSRRRRRRATRVVAVLAGAAAAATLAAAGVTPTVSTPVSAATATRDYHLVKTMEFVDRACRKKRAASGVDGPCRGVAKLRSTDRYRPSTAARTTWGDVAWCRDWTAEYRGLYYVNWKEATKGTFCWIEGPSAPDIYKNAWRCGYSSAYGYDVRQVDCWEERRTGDTTYGWWISVYDRFRVTAVVKGFPISATYQFHVNLHPTGNRTMYVD